MDVNGALSDIRKFYREWAESDAFSEDERYWSGLLANQWKELDEHLSAGGQLPADWDVAPAGPAWLTDDLTAVIRMHASAGRRIMAIKEVRTASGMGIRESKDWLDQNYPLR